MRIVYFILFFFISTQTYALESYNLKFNKIQVNDGLSENSVYCILQDSKGFMWFGTKDGLNKYDGVTFNIFRKDAFNHLSIGNNFVRSIIETDTYSLFVGTDNGLYKMDINNEEFIKIDVKTKDEKDISSAVNTLLEDDNGDIWIGTMTQGVFKYHVPTKELIAIPCNDFTLGKNAIWSFHKDKLGNIWLGTRLGLLKYNKKTSSLEKIDSFFSFTETSEHEVLSIYEDQSGNLWLGTWADGIRLFDKKTENYTSFLDKNSKTNYITHVRTIYEYKNNELLIGSDDGLYLFDIQNKESRRIDIPHIEYSLSDQNVYTITNDREGTIWVGTYFGGVNYMHASNQNIDVYHSSLLYNNLTGKATSQMCEDKYNNLWIATEDGGINYLNTKTNSISQPIKTSYHNTHALLLDGDDLWIGTFSRGIDIYNTKTGRITNYMHNKYNENTINDDCIFSLYKSKAGEIYAGTPVGLNKYNPQNKNFEQVNEVMGFVYDITEDHRQNIWVATYGNGAIKYDKQNEKWIHYDTIHNKTNPIAGSKLTSVYEDKQNRLLFTSEGKGIFIYNDETDNFRNISETDGFPNNVTYGVLDDDEGNWWISSNKGIICFNEHEPEKYKVFNREDGLQSTQFNYKSYIKTKNGKFYFGGINGLSAFYPEALASIKNNVIPSVQITNVYVLENNKPETDSYIKKKITAKDKIVLPYNQNSLHISFVSLSYINPGKNQYAYKLSGEDNNWIYADRKNNSVNYINLNPGVYEFVIKGSNNDGLWNPEATSIEIEIQPPWWLSIYAKIIYLLLATCVLFNIFNFYKKKQRRKYKEQLEALKNEQEMLAFKSKIEFFTTIAHEVKTPLSLIKAPLEDILQQNMASVEIKSNLMVIDKNCERLTSLVGQLLDFRKLDANKYILNPQNVNLFDLLNNLYERFKKTASSKNIDLQLQLPLTTTPLVRTDNDALTKITANLLTNALKYTTDTIILSLDATDHETYTISIEDNGKGISEFHKKLIFDPFFQIKNEYSKAGTGLGLSLAKSLAEALSGKIEVKDGANGGTIFSFIFSNLSTNNVFSSTSETIDYNVATEDKLEITDAIHAGAEPSILLIEDNEDLAAYITKVLKSTYSITSVSKAEDALIVLENNNFDLIISDIMLPGMDGLSFTKQVKNDVNFSHIPIIILSAKTENATKVEGLLYKADVFIEKPFSSSYLKAQIKSLLENRKHLLETFNKSPLMSYTSLTNNKQDERFIETLNNEIEENLSDEFFSVESLSDVLNISRSNLQRKLKAISGATPGDYLRNYRLKKACKLFIETDLRINEVAFNVGFSSPSYFTKVFQKTYQMLPKEFISKYNKQEIE